MLRTRKRAMLAIGALAAAALLLGARAFAQINGGNGNQVKAISVVKESNGGMTLFGIGYDDTLYLRTGGRGGRWTNWSMVSPGAIKSFCAGQDRRGNIQLFAVGMDDMAYNQWVTERGSWSGWQLMNGTQFGAKSFSTTQRPDGDLQVFAVGLDDQVYTQSLERNGGWTGWALVQ